MDDDIMLRGPENSPMLSGCGDSPAPPDSVLEPSLGTIPGDLPLDFIMHPFSDVPLKGSRGGGPFLDLLSEAFFPDNCLMMQEIVSDPNPLDGVNI